MVFQEGPSVIRERGERAERESTSSLTLTNSQSRVSSTLCSRSKYLVQKLGWPVHLYLALTSTSIFCSCSGLFKVLGRPVDLDCLLSGHSLHKSYAPTFSREFLLCLGLTLLIFRHHLPVHKFFSQLQ